MINKVSFKIQEERTDHTWQDKNLNIPSLDQAWAILDEIEQDFPTTLYRVVRVTEEVVYA